MTIHDADQGGTILKKEIKHIFKLLPKQDDAAEANFDLDWLL
jgi:hypothetical protein